MNKNTNSRDQIIDFMKGIAIISIMLCHSSQVIEGINGIVKTVCSFGQLGCQLFFFFTGFLIMKNYENGKKDSYKSIINKKLYNVLIPWYIAIILFFVATKLCGSIYSDFSYLSNTTISAIIINCLFINGLVPFANNNVVFGGWYLGTLVVIWFLIPVVLKLYNKYKEKALIILILVCVTVMICIGIIWDSSYVDRNGFWYFSFINQLPCVLYGMLFACRHNSDVGKRNKLVRGALCIIFSIVVVVLFRFRIAFSACVYPVLVSYITGEIFAFLNKYKNTIEDHLGFRIIAHYGNNSLYIYLIHILFIWYLQKIVWIEFFSSFMNDTLFFFAYIMFAFLLVLFAGIMLRKLCSCIYLAFAKIDIFGTKAKE